MNGENAGEAQSVLTLKSVMSTQYAMHGNVGEAQSVLTLSAVISSQHTCRERSSPRIHTTSFSCCRLSTDASAPVERRARCCSACTRFTCSFTEPCVTSAASAALCGRFYPQYFVTRPGVT
jgi:hypothetical protein